MAIESPPRCKPANIQLLRPITARQGMHSMDKQGRRRLVRHGFLPERELSTNPKKRIALHCPITYTAPQAPVAQLDRALPSEGRGLAFESRRVHQNKPFKTKTLESAASLQAHRVGLACDSCLSLTFVTVPSISAHDNPLTNFHRHQLPQRLTQLFHTHTHTGGFRFVGNDLKAWHLTQRRP